jgi:DNA-binding transcriptional MerR regulator
MFKIGDFSRLTQVSIKTLRYYDEIGLLKPAQIDRFTNYRYYTADQLPRLNRILALKDLGLSLDQITDLLKTDLAPDQMQAMLRQKRAEIAQQVAEEQARLARVEARLHQIEHEGEISEYDVIVKTVPALRVAGIREVARTYADGAILFSALFCYFQDHDLDPNAAYPWIMLYHDEGYRERDVEMTFAAPVDRDLPESERVKVFELPAVETMLSTIYRGPYEQIGSSYAALMKFMAANHYRVTGTNRNLFLHGPGQGIDPAAFVTEVQFPVEAG